LQQAAVAQRGLRSVERREEFRSKLSERDRRILDISGENGGTIPVDENMLLEAMPDFIPFLSRE
jgi:hypothetical protein